jgi:hypothetical protein
MSFKRNNIQEFIEDKCGCSDLTKWGSYQQNLIQLNLTSEDITLVNGYRTLDAISYWLKALCSYSQGLHGMYKGFSAWSIVKLYYSIFYCLRCELLLNSYLLVRNSALFKLNIKTDTQFSKYNSGKARGDHQLTIKLYSDLVANGTISDVISSNTIDDDSPYTWMLKQRERVNYQMQNFPDPDIDPLLVKTVDAMHDSKLEELLNQMTNSSDNVMLFDKDYSMVAIPSYKLKLLHHELVTQNCDLTTSDIELTHIRSILQSVGLSNSFCDSLTR